MSDWADKRRDGFKRVMRRMGLMNPSQIAKATGVPRSTVSSYWNGDADTLSSRTEARISEKIGLSADALYDDSRRDIARLPVPVMGYVGAAQQIDLFGARPDGFYDIPHPGAGDGLIGLEVRGGGWVGVRDGDLIYCQHSDTVDLETCLGEPCLVETGTGLIALQEVRRGYEAGTFNLIALDTAKMQENVTLRRAMPIVATLRRRFTAL